jgi:hypothetical protein
MGTYMFDLMAQSRLRIDRSLWIGLTLTRRSFVSFLRLDVEVLESILQVLTASSSMILTGIHPWINRPKIVAIELDRLKQFTFIDSSASIPSKKIFSKNHCKKENWEDLSLKEISIRNSSRKQASKTS